MEALPCVSPRPAAVSGLTSLVVLILVLSGHLDALRVIAGNKTVVQGESVILTCKLVDSTEELTQISWQRSTRGKPQNNNFLTVQSSNGPLFVNGRDDQLKFIGSFREKDGSFQISNVTLLHEGVYSCIFTLFPSGAHKTTILLNVLVPPVTRVEDNLPFLADEEVSIATCTAAGSKPPAEVRWLTGALGEQLRATTSSTNHTNGTTTTVSSLLGVPTKDINKRVVQCVVSSSALLEEKTMPFTIQVYFSPREVNITTKSKETFQCMAQANPSAELTWSRSGQAWPQSAVRGEDGTLQFQSMSSDLNGLYHCEASNQHGRNHGNLFVHVTSGSCTACWTLFAILLSVIIIGAAAWYLYKSGKFPRSLGGTSRKKQKDQSNSRGSSEEGQRVKEEDPEEEL
ncbi:putative poliovirus receptor-related protein 3-like isoform 2 [Scophthalmus maximus]|uniref:Putative poliovirus receptor-related protein 3-like n=1 Tax=Scophthalmus maximus TaxID=52904 RepID=A0A2U9C9G0_SCOMX|nr:nectin-1 isoform X1 [Scophthalmus maximus]AWP13247.1 putative poliovirus receptor-related protein 3-like [Scophthalmus maximus]AWP13248.1 putative poliovirus receptor-related protein 3-like isoform 2 [Scophthalmus maximus]